MKTHICLYALVGLAVVIAPAHGQALPKEVQDYLDTLKTDKRPPSDVALETLVSNDIVLKYITQRQPLGDQTPVRNGLIKRLEDGRREETGATGATSVVGKPAAPSILSAALESGAVTRSTQAAVNTYRVNTLAAYRFLSGTKSPDCSALWLLCKTDDANPLRGISVSLSLDTSRKDRALPPGTTPGVPAAFLKAASQISNVGVRYELYHRLGTASKDFQTAWDKANEGLRDKAGVLSQTGAAAFGPFVTKTEYRDTKIAAASRLGGMDTGNPQALARAWRQEMESFYQLWASSQLPPAQFTSFRTALNDFRTEQAKLVRNTLYRKVASVEYNYEKPADQATLSTVRLLIDTPLGAKPTDEQTAAAAVQGKDTTPVASLTFNFAATFYNEIPTGIRAGKWRDAQGSIQLERKLPELALFGGKSSFTLSGYFQYMKENAILQFNSDARTPLVDIPLPKSAQELLNTKGLIGIFQAGLSVPLGQSGVSMPFAITWANRTELIKANDVRGQFGLTFDLDKLVANALNKN